MFKKCPVTENLFSTSCPMATKITWLQQLRFIFMGISHTHTHKSINAEHELRERVLVACDRKKYVRDISMSAELQKHSF